MSRNLRTSSVRAGIVIEDDFLVRLTRAAKQSGAQARSIEYTSGKLVVHRADEPVAQAAPMCLTSFWQTRSERDRRVIVVCGVVLADRAVFALVWLPLERARARLSASLPGFAPPSSNSGAMRMT